MRHMIGVILLAFLCAPGISVPAEKKTDTVRLIEQVRFSLLKCELQARTAALKGDIDTGCANEQKKKIKPIYGAAANSLKNNKQATAALKDLYVYWIGTISTLAPAVDELKTQYSARMKNREAGVEERINRLLLETGEQ